MRGYDPEPMEAVGQMLLGGLAMFVLFRCLEACDFTKDQMGIFIPAILCFIWGPPLLLGFERYCHEKTGRLLRFVLWRLSFAILVVCSLVLIGRVLVWIVFGLE